MLSKLNLPEFDFTFRMQGQYKYIFDKIRKKYVALTPEEWVRQNIVQYLIQYKSYPRGLVSIEQAINLNKLTRRCDIILYNTNAQAIMIVECKAPNIKISQQVFDQIARYNMVFKVKYLLVTNGLMHYCCQMNYHDQSVCFLEDIPGYHDMKSA